MTDTGDADVRLAQALSRPADRAELLAALVEARVFVAVTAARSGPSAPRGQLPEVEARAELAVLLIEAPDGSRALPVFADLAALRRWRLEARPVALTGAQACAAALDEGAAAVIVDPAGSAVVVTELSTLAGGWVPVPGSSLSSRHAHTALQAPPTPAPQAWVRTLRAALAGEGLRAARLLDGPDGPVLGIVPKAPLTPGELAALAQRVLRRLGDELPPAGLGLAEVPPQGKGQQILRPRRLRVRR